MDDHYGYHTNHPLLKLLNFMDTLLTFKQEGEETISDKWQKFQAVPQPRPSHGMTDKALLECFYRGLGPENRSIDDQICDGGMLYQPYEVVEKLLDGMVEANKEAKEK